MYSLYKSACTCVYFYNSQLLNNNIDLFTIYMHACMHALRSVADETYSKRKIYVQFYFIPPTQVVMANGVGCI